MFKGIQGLWDIVVKLFGTSSHYFLDLCNKSEH